MIIIMYYLSTTIFIAISYRLQCSLHVHLHVIAAFWDSAMVQYYHASNSYLCITLHLRAWFVFVLYYSLWVTHWGETKRNAILTVIHLVIEWEYTGVCWQEPRIGVGTGGGGLGPPDKGTQYDRGPLTFEKCRPIFELKVTPYFQS